MFDRRDLPGFRKDAEGNYLFDLTTEEHQAVVRYFHRFKDYAFNPEFSELFEKMFAADALSEYARQQVTYSEVADNDKDRRQRVDNAAAAILKAISINEMPVYHYHLGQILEAANQKEQAIFAY